LFQPLKYLPNIDEQQLETICERVLEEICSNRIPVPDIEFYDAKVKHFLNKKIKIEKIE
jgi:hypothetical protein